MTGPMSLIGKYLIKFTRGFDKCSSDWVMRMDLDYFIHENDIPKLREYIDKYKNEPAIVLPQYQFFTSNRYQLKTKLCLLLNKKYPEIKLNGGTDQMLATLNGELLTYKNVPQIRFLFGNMIQCLELKRLLVKIEQDSLEHGKELLEIMVTEVEMILK